MRRFFVGICEFEISILVEMRRIELLSENIVIQLSPSAVGEKISIFTSPPTTLKKSIIKKVFANFYDASKFTISLRPLTRFSEKSIGKGWHQAAIAKSLSAFIFKAKFSLTEPVRETRYSLIKSHLSPSKPLHPRRDFRRFYKKFF